MRRRSTPFLCFLGRLLLRDRRSVVPVFVGLSLAFVASHGVETDGVFLCSLNYYGWLVSYYSSKNPLTGWTALFFGGAVVCILHGVPLKGAEVVTVASRPEAPCD